MDPDEGDDRMVPIEDGPNHLGEDLDPDDQDDDDVIDLLPYDKEEVKGLPEEEGVPTEQGSSSSSADRPEGKAETDKEDNLEKTENESWLPDKDWGFSSGSKVRIA